MCRPGYPRSDPDELGANANVGSLGIAESAAFGGGGCYLMRRPLAAPWLAPVRATWNAFLADNRYFNDRATVNGAGYVLQALGESHVLCDLMTERIFTPEWLARYPAIVAPFVRIMSESQRRALIDYAQAGGKLILLGNEVATLDRFGRERAPALIQELLDAATARDPSSIAGALEQGGALADMPLSPADGADLVRLSAYVNDPNAYDEVESVEGLELSVPLPPDTTATAAVLKVPGADDVDLTMTEDAKIVVPRLDIYGLVHIALKRGDA